MVNRELIESVLKGDEDAFKRLYELNKNRVYKITCMVLNDKTRAEDVLQEVFIQVYLNLYKLKSLDAFDSWIYKITINCCRKAMKKRKIMEVASSDETFDTVPEDNEANLPEPNMINGEMEREVLRIINSLPENQKICILLFYYNNLSIGEIADIIDCPEGTVKSRIFKAKRLILKKLKSLDYSEEGVDFCGIR